MAQPSPAAGKSSRDMNAGKSDAGKKSDMSASERSDKSAAKTKHIASRKPIGGGANNARENQETAQLNQSQASSNGMMMGKSGAVTNGNGNAFDKGRPQSAQAGGSDCSPDNPSCGTARQNPAINSPPQHRLQQASPGATSAQ